ncbi:putative ATP-dependent RNA helicase CG8611, partial [Araneus ventricosus]
KTLAYAIPIVQKLQDMQPKIKRCDGVYALIIVPTRELALQCFEIFSKLTKSFTWIVPGYLIGGEKKKSEKARLRKGVNILICTPGRLLDHLDHTACLTLEKIMFLIIDEADK